MTEREMNWRLDRKDLWMVLGLMLGVTAWSWLWAHPYPHPSLWPVLAKLPVQVSRARLAMAGHIGIGLFSVLAYLFLRVNWIIGRHEADDRPDAFLYTRLATLLGTLLVTLQPAAWRSSQFCAPGFVLVLVSLAAMLLWSIGRGGQRFVPYAFAYLVFGLVAGINPLGLVTFAYVCVSDVILRWQVGLDCRQREDDEVVLRRRRLELVLSVGFAVIGLAAAVYLLLVCGCLEKTGPLEMAMSWMGFWTGELMDSFFTVKLAMIAISVAFTVAGLAIGRRVRALGPQGLLMARVLVGVLTLAGVVFACRTVDAPERARLRLIGDYLALVVRDAGDAEWLFTDGRFDAAIRAELAAEGRQVKVLDVMTSPSPKAALEFRRLAPEPGERDIFAAGGSEVFRMWARERPDRLATAAWQLGSGVVRRHGKTKARTCGTVIRTDGARSDAEFEAADRAFAELSERVGWLAASRPFAGALFGDVDQEVEEKFDALMWRAARVAGERQREEGDGKSGSAERERELASRLDSLNGTLRSQGEVLERMLPTEKLVVTSREALEISLRRADFALASRYAREVLAGAPDDASAHFALGMAAIDAKDFFSATVHFEKMLAVRPNEPAALNNLAIAYLKLDQPEKALEAAERAAKLLPDSPEVQSTCREAHRRAAP